VLVSDTRLPGRVALPADARDLAPLGAAFDDTLSEGLGQLGVTLSTGAHAAIDAQARLLLAWNVAINLTALREPHQVARLHVLDSLSALAVLGAEGGGGRTGGGDHPAPSLLDLGSGGGYPGLPLGVALPARRVALVDAVGKKVRFLEVVAREAERAMREAGETPPQIMAISARAEQLAADPKQRGSWGVVTARAVGALPELVELGLPLLRLGGRLLCWKRDAGDGALQAEMTAAADVLHEVGGAQPEVSVVDELLLPGHRLLLVRKVRPTPARFPRPVVERRRALLG
jgi:16S rRNA (guanine527-N7)-methyltransferase